MHIHSSANIISKGLVCLQTRAIPAIHNQLPLLLSLGRLTGKLTRWVNPKNWGVANGRSTVHASRCWWALLTGAGESRQPECKACKGCMAPATPKRESLGSWEAHHTLGEAHPYGCASRPCAASWQAEGWMQLSESWGEESMLYKTTKLLDI